MTEEHPLHAVVRWPTRLSHLWSLLTALTCVLWRGFRGGDWMAFARYELPDGREEHFEWSARTGRYAWRRDVEEEELFGQDPDIPFP